jgi:L-alanine-DL-glutamate epimerase-like enolase superfamily enzyme
MKLGKSGPLVVADITSITKGAELDLIVSCMLESAVGIHASAHLVVGAGTFSFVDFDRNRLLVEDVIETEDGLIYKISSLGRSVIPKK